MGLIRYVYLLRACFIANYCSGYGDCRNRLFVLGTLLVLRQVERRALRSWVYNKCPCDRMSENEGELTTTYDLLAARMKSIEEIPGIAGIWLRDSFCFTAQLVLSLWYVSRVEKGVFPILNPFVVLGCRSAYSSYSC